ncbi:MAG: hypothetical protein ACJAXW_003372 [Candidatus Azotimanducaceae bacterium]|jgi:hypothetical protein
MPKSIAALLLSISLWHAPFVRRTHVGEHAAAKFIG